VRALRTEKASRLELAAVGDIRGEFACALNLYFGGDMESSIALLGQVAGRIDTIKPVAQIIEKIMAEFHATLAKLSENYKA
jgi:enoyl-[acyl-carrier protein] reductase II